MPYKGTPLQPGTRFGRLVLVEERPNTKNYAGVMWACQCDCGELIVTVHYSLLNGRTQSCGCMRAESIRAGVPTRTFIGNPTHGLSKSAPEYTVWKNIRARCNNPKGSSYERYGARGITVCPAWSTFEQFYADMGPRPSLRHSIERIDNDGPYSPENCRWATIAEQTRNRRSNVWLTHDGQTMTLDDWAKATGLKAATIRYRMRIGWTDEQALTTPLVLHKERQWRRRA